MGWRVFDLLWPEARRRGRAVLDRLEPWLARVRAAPRRTLVLAGTTGVLLLIASVLALSSGPGGDVPDDAFLGFYCPACDRTFELSHRQFKQLWDDHGFKRTPGRQSLVYKCRHCSRFTAVRAAKPGPAP